MIDAGTPDEGLELVKFLKDDPHYGVALLFWCADLLRTLERDCVNDETVHQLILKAISSALGLWDVTVLQQKRRVCGETMKAICNGAGNTARNSCGGLPGFSWHNMNPRSPSESIPRLKGIPLEQFVRPKRPAATMIYQAMFDE